MVRSGSLRILLKGVEFGWVNESLVIYLEPSHVFKRYLACEMGYSEPFQKHFIILYEYEGNSYLGPFSQTAKKYEVITSRHLPTLEIYMNCMEYHIRVQKILCQMKENWYY